MKEERDSITNAYIFALFDENSFDFDEELFNINRLENDYTVFEQTIGFEHSCKIEHQNAQSRR